ncbi:MAG TPA: hypothetical protein VHC22_15895 [Pirellulales bacterium]|nr:hypothetical protein [Pirellulales bacterium]
MDSVELIVAWIFFGVVMTFFVGLLAGMVAVMKELREVFRGVFSHLRKHPRFGIGALFTLVTVVAAACTLFRLAGDAELPLLTGFVALASFVFAVGIVLAIKFVADDFQDNWSRHRQSLHGSELLWPEPASSKMDGDPGLPTGSQTL